MVRPWSECGVRYPGMYPVFTEQRRASVTRDPIARVTREARSLFWAWSSDGRPSASRSRESGFGPDTRARPGLPSHRTHRRTHRRRGHTRSRPFRPDMPGKPAMPRVGSRAAPRPFAGKQECQADQEDPDTDVTEDREHSSSLHPRWFGSAVPGSRTSGRDHRSWSLRSPAHPTCA